MTNPYDDMTDEELWNSPLGRRVRDYADKLLTAEAERLQANPKSRQTDTLMALGLESGRAVVSPLGNPDTLLEGLDGSPTRADTDPWANWYSPERVGLRDAVKDHYRSRENAQKAAKAYLASLQSDATPADDAQDDAESADEAPTNDATPAVEIPVVKAPPTTPLAVALALGRLLGNSGYTVNEGDGFHPEPYVMMSIDDMVKILDKIPQGRW